MTSAARNRIAWTGAWSRGHNNARYEELIPRLENVDRYYVDMHPWWPVRGIRRRIWLPFLAVWLGMRYELILCTDWKQIRLIRNRVVCDHDDPLFGEAEIRALNSPNVAAVVVTSEAVKKKLSELGLRNPVCVIPQGVAIRPADEERVRAIRAEWRRSTREVVAGFHQPHFEFSSELPAGAAQQMYAVDRLLEILERARKKEPRLVLWLVGEPSRMVREYAEKNPWVRLPGYKVRSELTEYVAAFDIGLYPRSQDLHGRRSIKILEYMACGLPVVGFPVEEMDPVLESGGGITVRNVAGFADACVSVARSKKFRKALGAKSKAAAAKYDWKILSMEYRALLDRQTESGSRPEEAPPR
jgi:glycosyltransferase involved in cell wall biosynthesis